MTGPGRAPKWLTKTTYAHRGRHSSGVPENSLAAAKEAIASGQGIECDIQLSRDGTPFVFHDWDLERLVGEKGLVRDRGDHELQAMALLGTKQSPPSLKAFLATVAGRVPVLIEIKSEPSSEIASSCEGVLAVLATYTAPHAVMSFDPRVAAWFQEFAPNTIRGLVGTDSYSNGFEHVWRDRKTIEMARPDFLAVDRRDLERSEAAEWRRRGHPLLTWTIRTEAERKHAQNHADALIAEGEALT